MDEPNRIGTRIFKKSTPNGKLTIYLGKRDFYDRSTHVDPIEGVVLIDPDYVKDRKVYVNLLGAFRFGRGDIEPVDVPYYKEFYVSTDQVYPPTNYSVSMAHSSNSVQSHSLTRLQERLIKKLGVNAYPFRFQIPTYLASSVSVNKHHSDHGKSCCVEYELKVYVAEDRYDRPQKRNSVRMVIRKLSCAPEVSGPQPSVEVTKEFLMSFGNLRVEASLDKQKYYHGETIGVNVLVDNNSNKTIKKIKVAVQQHTKICFPSPIEYKSTVAKIQSEAGFPIPPSQTGWCKVYRLCPSLINSKSTFGLAVDGDLKHETTHLASSTISPPEHISDEALCVTVNYIVKVRLTIGFGISDVCLQLPFILVHRDPHEKKEDDQISLSEPHSLSDQPSVLARRKSSPYCSSSMKTRPPDGTAGIHAQAAHVVSHSKPSATENANSTNDSHKAAVVDSNRPREHYSKSLGPPSVSSNPFLPARSPLPGSSRLGWHISGAQSRSTVSEDDLFEDFARFRLHAGSQNGHLHPMVSS